MNRESGPIAPPRGFRDILPTEARELGVIEQTLAETFAASGFTPLHPPLLEYGTVDPAKGRRIQFLDSDGSLVALRPDLTTSVARLVAGRYREMTGVLCEQLKSEDLDSRLDAIAALVLTMSRPPRAHKPYQGRDRQGAVPKTAP